MHCSLLCSACENSDAAEIAWSNSFIDAYNFINWSSVIELAGDDRKLLYKPIACWFNCDSLADTRRRNSSGDTENCAPQFEHCVNPFFPEIGNTGTKNNVNHDRALRAFMSTSCWHRGQVVRTGADLSSERIFRDPNKMMNPRCRRWNFTTQE